VVGGGQQQGDEFGGLPGVVPLEAEKLLELVY